MNWETISEKEQITEEFIREHFEKLDFHSLITKQKLSLDFILEHQHKESFWYWFSENEQITEDILELFLEKWDWKKVSEYVPLSVNFMRKHNKKINMNAVVEVQNVTLSFLQEFEGEYDFYFLSMNSHLTDDILEYFKEKLVWGHVTEYNVLSFEIIKSCIAYIDLDDIFGDTSYSFTQEQKNTLINLQESIS